jgi:hypothetical protein
MRLFEPDDYQVIQGWFSNRGMPWPPYQYLPKIGFIEDFYAAGFLIQTDTPIAMIDFIISNPAAPLRKRAESVESVVMALIEEAKQKKFKAICSNSRIHSIKNLAKSLGFKEIGEFSEFYREI